ncbi:MAG: MoaD/ThiS family protein [Gemmatimonadales bacterium]|nr:MoaD/ThiS family protein [Gemmatimonadales bacterium]
MTSAAPSVVTLRVLLFGSYADVLGRESLEIILDAPARIRDAIEILRRLPGGDRLPPKPLCALNLEHSTPDASLSPGDELAVLPPLAGG